MKHGVALCYHYSVVILRNYFKNGGDKETFRKSILNLHLQTVLHE